MTLAALQALEGVLPEVTWTHGDDLCDCKIQRIGFWTNPYIGQTLRVRLCCLWAELYKEYPQFVQEIPAYYDPNEEAYIPGTFDWDSEDEDMPRYLWYRQEAARTGESLEVVRNRLRSQSPPKAVVKGAGRESKEAKSKIKW